jgi:hypothetical protein
MHPTPGAVKAPLAHARPGDEERPAGTKARLYFEPVRSARKAEFPLTFIAKLDAIDPTGCDRVLEIATLQDDREVDPWMIMKRSIVIAAQNVVQVDVEEAVAGDHPPALHVRQSMAPNDDIGIATRRYMLEKKAKKPGDEHEGAACELIKLSGKYNSAQLVRQGAFGLAFFWLSGVSTDSMLLVT